MDADLANEEGLDELLQPEEGGDLVSIFQNIFPSLTKRPNKPLHLSLAKPFQSGLIVKSKARSLPKRRCSTCASSDLTPTY
jgi:hypothetical protein